MLHFILLTFSSYFPCRFKGSFMDIVFIEQFKLDTIIGIHDWEREQPQPIVLDIEIGCCIKKAVQSDHIKDCVDYFEVCERIRQLAATHHFQLVETLVEAISDMIINDFGARQVKIKLSKPNAVAGAQGVGVIIERSADNRNT